MMSSKALLCIIFAVFAVSSVHAHTYLNNLIVGGTALARNEGIRPHPQNAYDSPIASLGNPTGLQSQDMTCGFLPAAGNPANRKITVAAGSEVGLQWWHAGPGDDVIDAASHKGPCIAYMARSDNGQGNVWFKIYEKGYDATSRLWCVDQLASQTGVDGKGKGVFAVTIPSDLAPGNYLLRAEIIALHEADRNNGAQPYVSCAELTVTGAGTAAPSGSYLVAFPGAYTATTPGILYNMYASPMPAYPIPGPMLYTAGSSGGGSGTNNNGGASNTGTNNNNNNGGGSNTGTDTNNNGGGNLVGDGSSPSGGGAGLTPGGAAALAVFVTLAVVALVIGAFLFIKHKKPLLFSAMKMKMQTAV